MPLPEQRKTPGTTRGSRPNKLAGQPSTTSHIVGQEAAGQRSPLIVYATRFDVIARSRKRRLVLIVVCPFCRDRHTHTAPVDFSSGTRTAACGGRYVLHTARRLAVVA
jgi:hypothetical protein